MMDVGRMDYAYGQFMVFDRDVKLPGCEWTDDHHAQGFARRASAACIRTLRESGRARVRFAASAYEAKPEHVRVLAMPFLVTSGIVVVEGPEETRTGRTLALPPGHHRLVVALSDAAGEEAVDLHFERVAEPLERSAILKCDDDLSPPPRLIETAEIAGGG